MRTTLTSFSLTILILLTISSLANAETGPIPERDPAIGLEGNSPLSGGASAACTIAYYNFCSGWLWIYGGFAMHDQVGIIYDLAAECEVGGGHTCTNLGNWWYWRYTFDGYCLGFGLNFDLFNVDADDCLTGSSIGSFAIPCPLERWNYVPGLGSTSSDRVALVGSWAKGTLPYAVTDNNVNNANGGPACAGVGIGNGTSYRFRRQSVDLCPPEPFEDALGPVNLMAISLWNCTSTTAIEQSSWTDLKVLFE